MRPINIFCTWKFQFFRSYYFIRQVNVVYVVKLLFPKKKYFSKFFGLFSPFLLLITKFKLGFEIVENRPEELFSIQIMIRDFLRKNGDKEFFQMSKLPLLGITTLRFISFSFWIFLSKICMRNTSSWFSKNLIFFKLPTSVDTDSAYRRVVLKNTWMNLMSANGSIWIFCRWIIIAFVVFIFFCSSFSSFVALSWDFSLFFIND